MKRERKIKPVAECKTLGEVMVALSAMVKELNTIPSVKAKISSVERK